MDKNPQEYVERFIRHSQERTPLDINKVYEETKSKCPVVLTHTYALENGKEDWDNDFPILFGKSKSTGGTFLLFDNGMNIIFEVYKTDGSETHWHPVDTAEAIADVLWFME